VTAASGDVVVLGAGMAGLCAAAAASQAGARVSVVEAAPRIGGSAALSHGNVWSMSSPDLLDTVDPGPFRTHAARVVDDFTAVTDWLAGFGAAVERRQVHRRRQVQRFDVPMTFLRMAQTVTATGGRVLLRSRVADVAATAGGFRLAVETSSDPVVLHAAALVVATGGRQADPRVRRELAPRSPVPLRGNRHSDGGGIEVGRALGGSVNFANRGFYGHLMPVGAEALSGLDLLALTLYHSTDAVLVDRDGHRFTDERRGDARNALALARHGGTGLLIWSERIQQRAARDPAPVDLAIDRWRYALDRGAQVARVDSVADLGGHARAWGLGGDLPALREPAVRQHLAGGAAYLAHVTPAITLTYGGLRATAEGNVLDERCRAVPGLFTAGGDLSDVYHLGYGGGLSAAASTGVRAGRAAAHHARPHG